MVQIGDKTIDYNEEFRLFMTTRNPSPEIPPDAASIVSEVNFTTTRAGLTGQVNYYNLHITYVTPVPRYLQTLPPSSQRSTSPQPGRGSQDR